MNQKKKKSRVAPSAEGGELELEGGKRINDIEMGDDQLELVEEEQEMEIEASPAGHTQEQQVATEPPAEEQVEEAPPEFKEAEADLKPDIPLPPVIHSLPPMKRLKTAEVDQILQNLKNMIGESFSTNIYEEISIQSLHKEYNKTVYEILDYRVDKKKK